MAKFDVQMVVRAKDEAAAALDTITEALTKLARGSEATEASGQKTSSTLSRLAQEAAKAAATLSATDAFASVQVNADKATEAFAKQETKLAELKAQREALTAQGVAAANVEATLATQAQKSAEAYATLKQQLKEAKENLEKLNSQTEGKKAAALSTDDLSVAIARANNAAEKVAELKQQEQEASVTSKQFAETLRLVQLAQKDLGNQTDNNAKSLQRETAFLDQSRAALQQLGSIALQAGHQFAEAQEAALSGAAQASAQAIAQQAREVAEETARQSAIATKASLEQALATAQASMRGAEATVKSLNNEIAKTAKPTEEQAQALANVAIQADLARNAYTELQAALSKVNSGLSDKNATPESLNSLTALGNSTKSSVSEDNAAAIQRATLEAKRDLTELSEVARTTWAAAQQGVQGLVAQISATGVPTRAEAEALAQLRIQALEAKTVFNQLQLQLHQVNTSFREGPLPLAQYAANQDRASSAAASASVSLAQLRVASENVNRLLVATGADAREAASGLRQYQEQVDPVAKKIDQLNDGHRQTLSLSERLRGQVLGLAASFVGLQNAISQIANTVTSFQALEAVQNRLNVVFGGDENQVRATLDWLSRNSARLGVNFKELSDGYSKIAIAARGTALEGSAVNQIFENFTIYGRVNKLTADQMASVFADITRIMTTGRVYTREITQQLGSVLPGVITAIKEVSGKTGEEFKKSLEGGDIKSDILLPLSQKLRQSVDAQLPAALKTTTTALGQLDDTLFKTKIAFAEAGFIEKFTEAVQRLNVFLKSSDGAQTLQSISQIAGVLSIGLVKIAENMRLVIVAFAAFASLKTATYLIGLYDSLSLMGARAVTAFREAETLSEGFAAMGVAAIRARAEAAALASGLTAVQAAEAAAAAEAQALGAASAGFGGIWGLAIAGVLTGLAYWATRTTDATKALSDHKDLLARVKDAYDQTGKSAENWHKAVEGITVYEATSQRDKLKSVVDDAFKNMENLSDNPSVKGAANPFLEGTGQAAVAIKTLKEQVQQIQSAFEQFKVGKLSVDEFKKAVDGIDQKLAPGPIKVWADTLIDSAEKSREALTAYKAAQDILQAKTDRSAEGQAALGRVVGSIVNPATEAASALVRYKEAVSSLQAEIPDLNKALEKQQKLIAIKDSTEAALKAIQKNQDFALSAAKTPDARQDALRSAQEQRDNITTLSYRAQASIDPKQFLERFNATGSEQGVNGLSDNVAKKLSEALSQLPEAVAKGIAITKGFITPQEQLKIYNAALAQDPNTKVSKPGNSPFEKGDAFNISTAGLSDVDVQKLIKLMAAQGYLLTASQLSGVASGEAGKAGALSDTSGLRNLTAEQRKGLKYNDPQLNDYATYVEKLNGLPDGILNAIKNAGEKSNSNQVSSAGAKGVMQFTPATFAGYGKGDAADPINSIDAAGKYIADRIVYYMKAYGVDAMQATKAAITEYNGGTRQGRSVAQGGQATAAETIAYNQRVFPLVGKPAPSSAQGQAQQLTFTEQNHAPDGVQEAFARAEELRKSLDKTVDQFKSEAEKVQGKRDNDFAKTIEGIADKYKGVYQQISELQASQIQSGRTDLDTINRQADAYRSIVDNLKQQEALAAADAYNKKQAIDAEQELTRLVQLQSTIRSQIDHLQKDGPADDEDRLARLRDRFAELTPEIKAAGDAAKYYADSLGGAEGEAMNLRVEQQLDSVKQTKSAWADAAQYNDKFASGLSDILTSAAKNFDAFRRGTLSIGQAFHNVGQAARSFFASFLTEIGQAIAKATLLKALTGSYDGGPGGIGGYVAQALSTFFGGYSVGGGSAGAGSVNGDAGVGSSGGGSYSGSVVAHTGGIIGMTGGPSRQVPPGTYRNALRYHQGGTPGLGHDEVPAILLKGEEVLNRTDPRNRLNGGGANGGVAQSVKIINAFDAETVVNEGLSTAAGEKAIINIITRNRSSVRSIIS